MMGSSRGLPYYNEGFEDPLVLFLLSGLEVRGSALKPTTPDTF